MFRIRILSCIIILPKLRIISFNKDNNDLYKKRELIFDDLLNQLLAFISQVGLTCPPNPSQVTRVDPFAPRVGFMQFLMLSQMAITRQGSLPTHHSLPPLSSTLGGATPLISQLVLGIISVIHACNVHYTLYVIGELILNDMTKIIMYTNNGQYI